LSLKNIKVIWGLHIGKVELVYLASSNVKTFQFI
jgi:hypothetical protein